MKDYTKMMKWAVVSMIDRNTQDDGRSKVNVEALFSSPAQAEDNYIIRNPEIKRYILNIENLERFEEFYNFIQDLNEHLDRYKNIITNRRRGCAPDHYRRRFYPEAGNKKKRGFKNEKIKMVL